MNMIISRENLFRYLGTKERKKQTIGYRKEKYKKKENREKEVGGCYVCGKGDHWAECKKRNDSGNV